MKNTQLKVIQLIQIMFNAAPGAHFLNELTALVENEDITENQLANILAETDFFKQSMFNDSLLTNNEFATQFINYNVGNLVSAENKAWAVSTIETMLVDGQSRGDTIHRAVTALTKTPGTDADWGAAARQFANKVDVASFYSIDLNGPATSLDVLQQVTTNIVNTLSSQRAAKLLVETGASGKVIDDGYVSGATVFVDLNGDGILNTGEISTTTNEFGNFTLPGVAGFGNLIVSGGTDIATNKPFEGTMTAPSGSTVVNPLTTLIAEITQDDTTSVAQATTIVLGSLGLDSSIDLLNFDPIAESIRTDTDSTVIGIAISIQAAAIQVNTLVSQTAALLNGVGVSADENTGIESTYQALAAFLADTDTMTVVDLTSNTVIVQVIQDAAATGGADSTQTTSVAALSTDAAQTISNLNKAIDDAQTASADVISTLINIAAIQIVAESIEASIGTGAKVGDVSGTTTRTEGVPFTDAVDAAKSEIGDVDGDGTSDATSAPTPTPTPTPLPPPVTFFASEAATIVTFGGTAVGNISVSWAGATAASVATFTRSGITATTMPDFGGTAAKITLQSGQTINNTAADLIGLTVDGAGSVAVTALNATLAADLSSITVTGGITAAFDASGTFAGNLGSAVVTVATGQTLTTTAAIADTKTFIGAGTGNIIITGSAGDQTITGTANADTITGGAGADIITGGAGADIITGGAGNDTIVGSADANDTYNVDSGTDTITVFGGADVLNVNAGATATVAVASDYTATAATRSVGTGTAILTLANDMDANLSSATIATAATDGFFITAAGNVAASTIVGSAGVDTLTGGRGADTIIGGAGGDTITGGAGIDTITGGAGNDTFVYSAMTDFVTGNAVVDSVTGGDGTADQIQVNAAIVLTRSDTLATRLLTVEQLVAETQSVATRAYSIVLNTDSKLSSIRAIDLSGDTNATSSGTINLTGVTVATTLTGVNGTSSTNTITGGSNVDTITGGAGADTITGGAGADDINGGDGDDTIRGGFGDDAINGDAGNDHIVGNTGVNIISGGSGDDTIIGGDGADDINGGDGDDNINGGDGDDTINGDAGNDRIVGNTGVNIISGGSGDDTIIGGDGADDINGGDGDDNINGGDGDDTINGDAGNDRIVGKTGVNIISGGSGDDTIIGGDGADTVTGGSGGDTLNGGSDADIYNYTSATDGSTTPGSGDVIATANFVTASDTLQFTDAAFGSLGAGNVDIDTGTVTFNTNEATTLTDFTTATGTDRAGYTIELTGSILNATLYDAIDTAAAAGSAATGAAFYVIDNGTDTVVLYDSDAQTDGAGTLVEIVTITGLANAIDGIVNGDLVIA